jgi:Fe-S cluster assembly protein SufD
VIPELDAATIVLIDGQYSPDLSSDTSTISGLEIRVDAAEPGISSSLEDDYRFDLLNTACAGQSVTIDVTEVIQVPLVVLNIQSEDNANAVKHPLLSIHAGKGSQVSIIEHFVSFTDSEYITNAVSRVSLDRDAVVEHYVVQDESVDAYHFHKTRINQGDGSRYRSHALSFGSKISRHDISVSLDGEHSECTLNGLYLGDDTQLLDTRSTIEHAVPNCDSHELYKGILDDKSSAVFTGKIHVHPDAQKTNAFQKNQVLLLSDDAQVNTQPQLEIFADDVKCSHGATIGQLDDDSIFYLRSRGIDRASARAMLTYAYAAEVIEHMPNQAMKDHFEKRLFDRFRG